MKFANKFAILLCFVLLIYACSPRRNITEPLVIEPAELLAFTDDFFSEKIEALHIPGLVFVFVQGGEVIYTQGYGYANLEQQTTIDPETSIMRIGSISKLFVATAVMQLVEQDLLDLHADVNTYLNIFQVANPFPEAVTLAHILTHTAGFEDPPYSSNIDPAKVQPLAEYLAVNMPPVTYQPGGTHLYSNHGYALAALIVENVSGISFDQYVDQNIFQPLGMENSQYLLSPPLPENLASGYFYDGSSQIIQPMDYDSDYPGGSIVSTAEDISHFIIAHLQNGCWQENCILQADTLAQMHQQQATTPYEGQNATFGFVESYHDDVRFIGHSGAIRGFGSSLNLMPEHDMGFFFSFNEECYQTEACQIIRDFREEFFAHIFR
jgi:CubicO group peptidase (beta-lactamase class C family)